MKAQVLPVATYRGDLWLENPYFTNTQLAVSIATPCLEPFFVYVRHLDRQSLKRGCLLIGELLSHSNCRGMLYSPLSGWLESRLGPLEKRVHEVPGSAYPRILIEDCEGILNAFPWAKPKGVCV